MLEKNIMESYKEKTEAICTRDSKKFAELMAYSHKEAAQYCIDCGNDTEIGWVNVKDIVKWITKSVKTELAPEVQKVEGVEGEIEWKAELSVEDLREILTAKEIPFKKSFWIKKLVELATDNNII